MIILMIIMYLMKDCDVAHDAMLVAGAGGW
jgi:hypothetical protein